MTPVTNRTFEIDLHFRRPEFLRSARLDSWDGRVLLAPRTQLGEVLARKEANRPSVYFLRSEYGNRPKICIGSATTFNHGIRNHNNQNWWKQLVVLSATAPSELNASDAIYLESKLIKRAQDAGRVDLQDTKAPSMPRLAEQDRKRMEHFFTEALLILPMLRIDDFVDDAPSGQPPVMDAQIFYMVLPDNLGEAYAVYYMAAKKFIVLAGSNARREWIGVSDGNPGPKARHAQLLKDGILVPDGTRCRFAKDCEFTAPSTAAKVVAGAPRSGTLNWKIPKQKTTLREWLRSRPTNSSKESR